MLNQKGRLSFNNFLVILLLGIVASGMPVHSFAQLPAQAKLDQFFDRLAEKNKAMGSLYIAKNGVAQYARSIGYARFNETEKVPLIAISRYRIGSITKMFTAVMVLQLVEEGKLKLDQTLDRFFPQLPNATKITVAQLLAHRSGIHDITADRDFRALPLRTLGKPEMLALMAKAQPDFEPGTKYSYSNAAYYLLGDIIERLTKQPYEKAVVQKINTKIGLTATYPAGSSIDTSKNECFSFKYTTTWEQQPETPSNILLGAGSMVSTPADLAKFIQALFNHQLISEKSLNLMIQQQMGMDTFTFNGKTAYGHTGGIDGFGSWLAYVPEQQLAVAYSANAKVYPVGELMEGVFSIYWNQPFELPTFKSLLIAPEVLDSYTGIYAVSGAPVKFTVSRKDDKLFMQMNGQALIPLEPIAPTKFSVESAGMEIEFNTDKKQMIMKRSGGERVLTKEN